MSAREILLVEMILQGIHVPAEQVMSRVIQELPSENLGVEQIKAMRRNILSLFVHPVPFHELLLANKDAPPARIHQLITEQFHIFKIPVSPRYLDAAFVERATVLWTRFCLDRLEDQFRNPPCKLKRIFSAVHGRPLYGWALSKDMQEAALIEELFFERTGLLVS
jgi:hypothetical protein